MKSLDGGTKKNLYARPKKKKKSAPTEMGTNKMTQEETQTKPESGPFCETKWPSLWRSVIKVVEGVEALQKPHNEFQLIHFIRSEEGGLESAIRGILGTLWGDQNTG